MYYQAAILFLPSKVLQLEGLRSATKSIAGVVTVGYDSPAIRELEYQAKAVSITLLNEVGVNPGAYHLYAIKARVKGMMQPRLFCRFWPVYLVKFHSYRGEIHAIEVSDSPLRFEVRWPIPCTDVPPCVTSNFPVSSAATRRLALATELLVSCVSQSRLRTVSTSVCHP